MLLGGALLLFSVLSTLAEGQNTSCGNDFKTLEKALLQTGNNKVELLKAFYPPRQPPATFVTVNYTFLDADGNITCNKTWFWSSVEFYLIQTPTIFQFMSLFFTITQDRITTANITFQGDCQELVSWNENGSCTCTSNSLLDILTQQLKFYAKVDDIRIDANSLGTAVCEDEEIKEYGGVTTALFIAFNVVIFVWIITLPLAMVYSIRSKIHSAMEKEQNHANLAALALTGLVFSTLVLVPDIWAQVLVHQGKQEFSNNSQKNLLHLVLGVDLLGLLVAWGALVLTCYLECRKFRNSDQYSSLSPQPQIPFKVKLSLGAMCFAPIFFVASHSGHIIIAYVSDTQHAGSATSWYIISFFYFFIIFRQLYKICSKLATKCKTGGVNESHKSLSVTTFNLLAFFMEIVPGAILVAIEVFVIYVLVSLPATLTAVSTDIYHLAQLAFVLITGLFAYKFIYTEDEPKQFVKALVETYQNKLLCLALDNLSNVRAAGKVLGGLAFTITRQYSEDESQQLMEAFAENYKATYPVEVLHASNNAESVGKVFGRLAFTIKHTDELMDAFVKNFKATNPEALHLDEQYDTQAAGRVLGGLAFTIMNHCTEDEPQQLTEAFVENFKKPTNHGDLHLHEDHLHDSKEASKVFSRLAFEIIQQYSPKRQYRRDEEARKVFVETFQELHLHNARNVLGTLAFRNIHNILWYTSLRNAAL